MNRSLTAFFGVALLGAACAAQAEPAIYHGGKLVIPNGAIFTDARQQYFTDIEMTTDSAGKLTILAATPMPLVYVETVDVTVTGGSEAVAPTVTVDVTGNKSVPCVALLEPAIHRNGNTFHVLLAETVQGPAESCIQVLDPFETEFTLDVSGLGAGSYKVIVNDEVEASFVLEADAP